MTDVERWLRVAVVSSLLVVSVAGASSWSPATPPRLQASAVRAACDVLFEAVIVVPGVKVERRTGTFTDEALAGPVDGCGVVIAGSFKAARASGDAVTRVRENFADRMWQEMVSYAADGKDGTAFAFRRESVGCLVRGRWNGGADTEPGVPAEDWYEVVAFCATPVFPERRPR